MRARLGSLAFARMTTRPYEIELGARELPG